MHTYAKWSEALYLLFYLSSIAISVLCMNISSIELFSCIYLELASGTYWKFFLGTWWEIFLGVGILPLYDVEWLAPINSSWESLLKDTSIFLPIIDQHLFDVISNDNRWKLNKNFTRLIARRGKKNETWIWRLTYGQVNYLVSMGITNLDLKIWRLLRCLCKLPPILMRNKFILDIVLKFTESGIFKHNVFSFL